MEGIHRQSESHSTVSLQSSKSAEAAAVRLTTHTATSLRTKPRRSAVDGSDTCPHGLRSTARWRHWRTRGVMATKSLRDLVTLREDQPLAEGGARGNPEKVVDPAST